MWQRLAKRDGALIFGLGAHAGPARMIAIPRAPLGVASGGSQLAAGIQAGPDSGPGGWDAKVVDTLDLAPVGDTLAGEIEIGKRASSAFAVNARRGVMNVAEASDMGGLLLWVGWRILQE